MHHYEVVPEIAWCARMIWKQPQQQQQQQQQEQEKKSNIANITNNTKHTHTHVTENKKQSCLLSSRPPVP